MCKSLHCRYCFSRTLHENCQLCNCQYKTDVVALSFGNLHFIEDGSVVKGFFFIFVKRCHLARATLNQTDGTYYCNL